jgi:sodium/pantothenate symporter
MLSAGLCSSGTFIGTPGLAYKNGIVWTVLTNWQNFMNLMVLGVIGKKIGIIARRTGARSFLSILGSRYEHNKTLVLVAGVALMIFLIPYTSVQFIGGARLIQGIIGWDYTLSLILVTGIVLFYTIVGGVRGATLAAAMQGGMMTLTALLLLIGFIAKSGGVEAAMVAVQNANPELLSPTAVGGIAPPKYMASFAVLFGFCILGMPHAITPALIYKNSRSMLKSIVLGAIAVTIWTVMMSVTGTLVNSIDPALPVSDLATPTAAAWALSPFLQGLIIAGVTAAIQSTVASMLILMSSSVATEMFTIVKLNATDEDVKKVSIVATIFLGLLSFGLSVYPPEALEWIVYFAIAGLESAFFFPVLLGLYWKRVNPTGALAGILGGLAGYIAIAGYLKHLTFGMHAVVMGVSISFVCLMIGTYLGAPPSRKTLELYWGKYSS